MTLEILDYNLLDHVEVNINMNIFLLALLAALLPPDAPGREKIRRKIIDLVTQQTEAVN